MNKDELAQKKRDYPALSADVLVVALKLQELVERGFLGKVEAHFNGKEIAVVTIVESLKPQEIAGWNGGRPR